MVPPAEADFLVVLAEDQIDNNRPRLREGGVLVATTKDIRCRIAAQPRQHQRGPLGHIEPSP